ncbi:NAD(P)/FAD-dependent oxidoreductase [Sphingorhabdus sp.]|uniref:NAD(P)/FAD-dependent oxidoreductase n=1 Tax=Sphingorhabdus sp. TaxID=1902408 RepID=UPI00391D553E
MPDRLNDSYYRATANAWETQLSLDSALDCDVVVIGGGFTGLSAALACAEKGLSVILVEAHNVGFGASGRNGGQLIPGLRWSMQEIDAEFGRERAQAIFGLAWSAGERVHDRIKKHNIDCDLKSGHLEAAYKPEHFNDMQREAEFLSREFGWESIKVVAPEDMGDHINGGDYHGGVYDPKGGHFHPLNYALGLAKAALRAGVRIYENTTAQAPTVKGTHVEMRAGTGSLSADHVILAADNWTSDLAQELGNFTVPIMNYNIATIPLSDADQLLPSDAAIADSRFVLNYFRLSADKRLIFGGGEKYVQQPPSDIAAFVRKHMAEVFPSLAQTPIDYAWGGAVGVTMNRLPHIGRKGNVFYAHGFSGHGALVTTLTGELMAEAVVGTMSRFDVFASLPHNRFPGGKWLSRPLATLGLLYYAMRDRL